MRSPSFFTRLVLSLVMVLGLFLSRVMAQYLPAYPNAFNAGCNGDHIERTTGLNAEARIDPEWARITDTPTILEGTVATPGELYSPELANNQAPSEVAESDIPWTHYTHDKTSNVLPDPEYQSLLSSWSQVDIDATGNILHQYDNVGHHTFMEVEWDNASTMYELFASSPYYDNQRGAIPEFVWPSVGNRVWVEGQYIFDCGHPGTPPHVIQVDGFNFELHYQQEVRYATEIHPPRALVTYRLNHPLTTTLDPLNPLAPELPTGSSLPVTGGQTMVPVTEADIYVTARGGGAVDHCSLITRHIDAIDGLLSAGISGFDSCTHTGPIQTVNDTNYVFDIYPPGTDYSKKPGGVFTVTPPTRDGSGHDVSLQWRIIDRNNVIPDNLGTSIKTVTPILLCPIDATIGPPSQTEDGCPPASAYPTRLRVILPFKGADANAFAATILLGWDDVPTSPDPPVRTFDVRLEDFQVDHNGEGFNHHGHGDWRVFVDVGGQWKYVSGMAFDLSGDGSNACNGDALTNMDDNDCFYFHGQPWRISVLDGNPIHVAVGGWESDSVDDEFCTNPTGCDPSTDAGIALALEDNDRIGTLEFDLDPAQDYQTGVLNTGSVDTLGPIKFHTPQIANSDGTNFYVTFSATEISPPSPPSSTLTVGTPNYIGGSTFVTSATPLTLATTSLDNVGFQYRFHRDSTPLPTFSSFPFPLHWTTTGYNVGPATANVFLNSYDGADGGYTVQYSAQTSGGVTEPRHLTRLTLDNTPPVTTFVQPAANAQYGHSDTLALSYSVSDGSGSGVKSLTPKMDGQTAAQFGASLNSGASISLLSMSLGNHTFSVDSVDNVDNAGINSAVFTIVVTFNSLMGDVNDLVSLGCMDNISQSLLAKISVAQNLNGKGNNQTATNILAALINEVQAQAGKHISNTCKDSSGRPFDPVQLLLGDTQYLQGTLSPLKPNLIIGSVLNASDVGIAGVTVNLNSSKTVIATATTDSVGLFYFPDASVLSAGANYTTKVTLPKGYKSSTPSSLTFTWQGNMVTLSNLVLK
jgi:hypothetical protein